MVLPRLAEGVVRDRLGGSGEVVSVDVRAFPAVTLLWRHADRVTARVRSYDATGVDLADELAQTAGVGVLDVRIGRVDTGHGVTLRDLRVRKRDGLLTATAVLDGRQLAAALPLAADARLVPEPDGTVVLEGDAGPVTWRARVVVRDGAVVVAPEGLLGLFARATVFSDRRVRVERIAARPLRDERFRLDARARVG